jgi:hypothetical protein
MAAGGVGALTHKMEGRATAASAITGAAPRLGREYIA